VITELVLNNSEIIKKYASPPVAASNVGLAKGVAAAARRVVAKPLGLGTAAQARMHCPRGWGSTSTGRLVAS